MKTALALFTAVLSCCIVNLSLLAQQPGIHSLLKPIGSINAQLDEINTVKSLIWTEIVSERTLLTSTYKSNDGHVKIVNSQRPINYYNSSNELSPINADLIATGNRSWSAKNQPYPTYLNEDASFSLTLANTDKFTLGKNCSINGIATKPNLNFTGNQITIAEIVQGIDKQLLFYENAVKYNYILSENYSTSSEDLIFSEEIILPKNYSIIIARENGNQSSLGWEGDLNIVNEKGDILSTIYAPVCYDAQMNSIIGAFRIKSENSKLFLEIIVPANWLNDSSRIFPIVIDPLVTGPTTTWAGGSMPSCILPSYNMDSIQVTIPAEITMTGLFITASFYADPFTTATMAQGSMKFSTSCGTSQTFTITGPDAALPGTGYLDSFNILSPLACCYSETCGTQSFYLTMLLGRTGPGTGCNTSYIRYDPFTTLWPFQAVMVGKTVETYGNQWFVPQAPICSNDCTITGRAYAIYGVPPYTYTHPWSTEVVTQGSSTGCANGSNNYEFTLTIPNCPDFCDPSFTSLSIPPPVVTDACGNLITGYLAENVPIKTAPQLIAVYDSLVCSGIPAQFDLISCIPNTTMIWQNSWASGVDDFNETFVNTSYELDTISYAAFGTSNGCTSDTLDFSVYVEPLPSANFMVTPEFAILSVPVNFTDATTIHAGTAISWDWSFGDGEISTDQNPIHTFTQPGTYQVCLDVMNDNGCIDTLCKNVVVAPAEISVPNVLTSNDDGVNELLEFKYLEFYPDNSLKILNRWGSLIYEKDGYQNDWNGSEFTEGTYFYILTINGKEQVYSGFFQIIK